MPGKMAKISKCFVKRRKNIGSKRVDLDDDCIDLILRAYEDFADLKYYKVQYVSPPAIGFVKGIIRWDRCLLSHRESLITLYFDAKYSWPPS